MVKRRRDLRERLPRIFDIGPNTEVYSNGTDTLTLPEGPWQKIAIDIKFPLPNSEKRYLIVIVDHFSKWPEVIATNPISSDEVLRALKKVFSRLGYPGEIVSGNGKQLIPTKVTAYLNEVGIRTKRVPLYAPSQNGLVERFNRNIGDKLKEC